jgi:hypothetical protein
MTAPVEPKVEWMQYGWLSLVALFGSIARAGKWVDESGKFIPGRLVTEVATAVVLGVIAASFGAYMSYKPEIVGGIAGGLGLIGPAGVTGFIQNLISNRLGGKKDGSDPKPS